MKSIYLFGHTGSKNRGCEAIVRSTSNILKKKGIQNIKAMVYNDDYDKKLGLEKEVDIICRCKCGFFLRAISKVLRKYFKSLTFEVIKEGKDLKEATKDDKVFVIGGDTYCYDFPYSLIALNKAVCKKGLKNVFWGCSVEENILTDKRLLNDINSYSYIVTRESLSYEIFRKALKDDSHCDPAFNLGIREIPFPQGFKPKNTVGINLSPAFFTNYKDKNDLMRKNIRNLIDYIIKFTEMNVCFVPHVYDYDKQSLDIAVLKEIFEEYRGNTRISFVNGEYSCEELKYIISNCRFFIGARTHSMIAAYSTSVPALALSYSIKSRGIAKDIYGDEEFVLQYKKIINDDEILSAFKRLNNRENELKEIYQKNIEEYKASIYKVAEKILKA